MKKLTCSYGKTAIISMIKENNEPIMVIDMDIKDYVIHIGHDSGEYNFPGNVVINDKLYLNEKLKNELLETLDEFIETTYIQNPEAKETARGFKHLDPKDIYGNTISIQESSNMDPAIWFGVSVKENSVLVWREGELKPFKYPSHHIMLKDRLHLKTAQAKKFREMIVSMWDNFENQNTLAE